MGAARCLHQMSGVHFHHGRPLDRSTAFVDMNAAMDASCLEVPAEDSGWPTKLEFDFQGCRPALHDADNIPSEALRHRVMTLQGVKEDPETKLNTSPVYADQDFFCVQQQREPQPDVIGMPEFLWRCSRNLQREEQALAASGGTGQAGAAAVAAAPLPPRPPPRPMVFKGVNFRNSPHETYLEEVPGRERCPRLVVEDKICERATISVLQQHCANSDGSMDASGETSSSRCSYEQVKNLLAVELKRKDSLREKCVLDESLGEGEPAFDLAKREVSRGPRLVAGYRDEGLFDINRRAWESEPLFFRTKDGARKLVVTVGDRPKNNLDAMYDVLSSLETNEQNFAQQKTLEGNDVNGETFVCAPDLGNVAKRKTGLASEAEKGLYADLPKMPFPVKGTVGEETESASTLNAW
eukprot:CAMPEP_0178991934 /NCGR_PEP_ID=MMETSP0795-20121207/5819_1 /TAXON_ID=88552 /ORGANISM="Amoebophrya sp., Strain Ameob2" /LENGTH=409 /DNA_ID=CAMNT_0020683729 /DNA_START=110 /DNA_END=1336 /DNA_ORIENTATION=-